jgi:hypothetical protein
VTDPGDLMIPDEGPVVLGMAPPDEGRWYHLLDGFYFRGAGGDVSVAVWTPYGHRVVSVTASEWASAVAAVSRRGDVGEAWRAALAVHEAAPSTPEPGKAEA